MQLVYTQEAFPDPVEQVIFLAGPTPRDAATASWRPEAIALLEQRGFRGAVLVPEFRCGPWRGDYDAQIAWELEGLARADAILFWVPRRLPDLPAFTTNVEFGYWASSGRAVFGAPPGAEKVAYLRNLAGRIGVPCAEDLGAAVDLVMAMAGPGARRSGVLCSLPAEVVGNPGFRSWYAAQLGAGNSLEGARVVWTLRAGPPDASGRRPHLFYLALHVDVRVAAEGRNKRNEVVLFRPDVAAVVLLCRAAAIEDTEIALVREFRSPANTADGFVRECPGGSSFGDMSDLAAVARAELSEEAGLTLPAARFRALVARQLAATFSAHRAHVFAAELTADEMAELRAKAGQVHGADEGERTTVEVWRYGDLLARPVTDWSTLGMLAAALGS